MNSQPVLIHESNGDQHQVAASLRVLISACPQGGFVAQGLEIDYCSEGDDVEEAQRNFVEGFMRTVRGLLEHGRDLSALFKSTTPREIWQEYMESARKDQLMCAAVLEIPDARSIPGIPFQNIQFCKQRLAAVA